MIQAHVVHVVFVQYFWSFFWPSCCLRWILVANQSNRSDLLGYRESKIPYISFIYFWCFCIFTTLWFIFNPLQSLLHQNRVVFLQVELFLSDRCYAFTFLKFARVMGMFMECTGSNITGCISFLPTAISKFQPCSFGLMFLPSHTQKPVWKG